MLDRKSAPSFVPVTSFHLPSPQETKLPGGASVIQLGGVQQDILKIELIFKAGKVQEPAPGISYFTAQLLEKGTRTRTSFQIADFFDSYGASIEITPGADYISVALYALSRNIKEVLPVFIELVTEPAFPQDELDLAKSIFLQNLKINLEKNSYVASKLLRQNIFGASHPYGSSLEEEHVNALSHEQLKNFFNEFFSLVEVYVTGSINTSLQDNLIAAFSLIRVVAPRSNSVESIKTTPFLQKIEKEDSVQSSIRLGKKSITRANPDYASLVLLNHIFGGYFGSRLMKNIREEKGLTYGIYSSLTPFKTDAFLAIGADVNKSNLVVAVAEIRKELGMLRDELITPSELEIARNHLLGSLQIETSNPFSVLEKIKTIRLNQLPADFYSTLFSSLSVLDSVTLQKTANTYLQDDFFEVSVG